MRKAYTSMLVAWLAGCAKILGIDHDYGERPDYADLDAALELDAASGGFGDAGDSGHGGPAADGASLTDGELAADADPPADGGEADGGEADGSQQPEAFDCQALEGVVSNGHCYFVATSSLSWSRAKSTCETFPASHLADLASAEEQEAVEEGFFPSTTDYWIGLSLENASTQVPPSSCRFNPASCPFRWVTGATLAYTKWARRTGVDAEPNYTGACVRLQASDSSWADLGCGSQLPALCEHDGP